MTKIILFVAYITSAGQWAAIPPAVFDNPALCTAAADFWRAALHQAEGLPNENIVTLCHNTRIGVGKQT